MRALSARERRVVFAGAVVVVLFAYAFGLLLPARRAGAQVTAEKKDLAERLSRANNLYEEASGAAAEIAALRERVDGLLYPEAEVTVASVRALENLAKDTGVVITRIRPEDPSIAAGSVRYPATVEVQATFSELVRLLYELERPETRLWVEGVEIATGRQAGDDLLATVHVVAYRPAEGVEDEDARG